MLVEQLIPTPSFNFIERLIFVAVLGEKKKKKCDSASVTVGNGQ